MHKRIWYRGLLVRLAHLPIVYASMLLILFPLVAQAGSGKLGQPCSVNEDCAVDLFCYGAPRLCRPMSAGIPTDVRMNGMPTGKEIPPCHTDTDCPTGFHCSTARNDEGLGGCGAGNDPCLSNKDCATGWECIHRDGKSFCNQVSDQPK